MVELFDEFTLKSLIQSMKEVNSQIKTEGTIIRRTLDNPAGILSMDNSVFSDFIKIHSEQADLDDKITLFPFLLDERVSDNTFMWITNMNDDKTIKNIKDIFMKFNLVKTKKRMRKNNISVVFSNDIDKGYALINKNLFNEVKIDYSLLKYAAVMVLKTGINFIMYNSKTKTIEYYTTLGDNTFNEYMKFRYFISSLKQIDDFEFLHKYRYENKFEKEVSRLWKFTLINIKSFNNKMQVLPLGGIPIGTIDIENDTFVVIDNMQLKYPYIKSPTIINTSVISNKPTSAYILPWTYLRTPVSLPRLTMPQVKSIEEKTKKEILTSLRRDNNIKDLEKMVTNELSKAGRDIV